VSTKTGLQIKEVDKNEPGGFGLGVAKVYKPGLGVFWFYEGETLGYRVVHAYFPYNHVIIAVGLNSQPRDDQVGVLIGGIINTLKANGLF